MDRLGSDQTKSLFTLKQNNKGDSEQYIVSPNDVSSMNKHSKKVAETYKDYGFRVAGLCEGDSHTLEPCLQTVYFGIKREQENDLKLQQELQDKYKSQKANLELECKDIRETLDECKKRQEAIQKDIDQSKSKLVEIENRTYERNKESWITFILCSILLVPFSIYLFVFYSSVAYSAFFKEFDVSSLDSGTNFKLSQAIFDAAAIPNAWNDGIVELIFILFMPIIFLAFGFVLNKWERENGWLKCIKIPLLIFIAFIFDSLLAFEICEKIYNLKSLMSIEDTVDYSFSLAAKDPRFWVIICLGFISYLIWGFVYGYWVKSWENLDLNKLKKAEMKEKIASLEGNLQAEIMNAQSLRSQITEICSNISQVDSQIRDNVRYDIAKIKMELNNFFSGWLQYLTGLNFSIEKKEEATIIFKGVIDKIKI